MHPANRLLIWCVITVALSHLALWPLTGIVFIMLGWALWVVPNALKRSVFRLRWLLLALIVIAAWSTPGVYVISHWYAPSQEGLLLGVQQALRLIGVITSLQIALKKMDRTQLLSACYQLSRPLAYMGIDNTRFAVRLGLSLYYAEQWLKSSIIKQGFKERMQQLLSETPTASLTTVTITILPFSTRDCRLSLGVILLLILLLISFWI